MNPENSSTTYYFIYKKPGEIECEEIEGCGPETPHGGPLTGDTQQEVPALEVTGLEAREDLYLLADRQERRRHGAWE